MPSDKTLLFTFDYELFLGESSGSVMNCMIRPTNEVIALFDKYKVKGVFFIDCTYLIALKKVSETSPSAKTDLDLIKAQIHNLLKKNHTIYPHIHPHWLDAEYNKETNQWSLKNLSKYRFHALTQQEKQTVFLESFDYLKQIVSMVSPEFKMEAYRAGGWSIQPFEDFKPFFIQNNISTDFSVLGGAKKDTNASQYDFTNIPTNAQPYRFGSDPGKMDNEGLFNQQPISSIKINKHALKHRILNKLLWRSSIGKNFGDGIGVKFKSNIEPTKYDLNYEMVSIELLTVLKLKAYKAYLKTNNYMQFISHPKMVSRHNLKTLERFIKHASTKYLLNSDWTK